ncbi:TerC family protein [Legionella sp. W05-934-2]|jgi:predicted tellurium resistance membrane protein TerC|uniref:TerC family protein n=1 Tax=Legionella sp. W05-934-2 TaxID=1198649 RepID=UPI0034636C42
MLDIVASLLALIILEIILGIDNLVFLSIMADRLPDKQKALARRVGLGLAWITRLLLLAFAFLLVKLTFPLFSIGDFSPSIRDLFLMFGGAFLMVKATQEIHAEMAEDEDEIEGLDKKIQPSNQFLNVVIQIALLDIIFSLDSVLTAIGLTHLFWVMALSITIAIIVMIFASDVVSHFIEKHPTIKMLALSFLILIGMVLIADGFSFHVPRGYVYFAMAFSLGVESLNLIRHRRKNRGKR